MNKNQWYQILFGLLIIISFGGCTAITPPVSQEVHSRSMMFSLPQEIADLAGFWEYKDGAGQGIIKLDVEGKGVYEWEEGRFEILSLENGTWTGKWIQEGNDREGEFELTFSDDFSMAQGEWWYTRIGEDTDPLQPGGSFSMSRSPTVQIGR